MSRIIGSKYGVQGVLAVAIVAAGAVLVATPHLVTGQTSAPISERGGELANPLDARTYTRVQSLRREAGLTNEDLATLDMDTTQAEAVMTGLLGWVEQNQARLDAAEAKQRVADRELRELQRRINVGPRDERLIRSMKSKTEAAHQALEERQSLNREAARQALAVVRSDQKTMWEAVHGTPQTPGRGFGQTSETKRKLIADFEIAKSGRPVSRDATGRKVSEDSQQRSLRQARSSRLYNVNLVEQHVLPIPEELLEANQIDPEIEGALEHEFEQQEAETRKR